jgi:transcriptional regulator with XRE-family HTH domain
MDEARHSGSWLKARREALDLTQRELAFAVSCPVSTLRKIEAGWSAAWNAGYALFL